MAQFHFCFVFGVLGVAGFRRLCIDLSSYRLCAMLSTYTKTLVKAEAARTLTTLFIWHFMVEINYCRLVGALGDLLTFIDTKSCLSYSMESSLDFLCI